MPDEDPEAPPNTNPEFDAVQAAAEFAAAMAEDEAEAPAGGASGVGNDKYTALLEDEVETLRALLAEREEALAAAHAKAAAAVAEVDRVRVRLEGSVTGTIERKRRSVIASFLDVADALDRAVAELTRNQVAPLLAEGIRAVRSELHNVLGRHGARHRPSIGEAFDPAHHEAIATAPATADTPAGTISAVLSEGYEIGEETLRVARVVVAKG